MVSLTTYKNYIWVTQVTSPIRLIYSLLGIMMMSLLLASCGGGAGTVGIPTGKGLYTTAPTAVNIALAGTVTYEIGGGTATYKASSSNANVASVEVRGSSLTIKGVLNGTAQIVISDATGTQIGINVTVGNTNVDLFVTAPSSLTIAPGLSSSYVIGGGRPAYFVSSSNAAVATVGVNNNSFFISGIKAGTAQIIVVDSTGTAVTINVTVGNGGSIAPLYVTAAGTINSTINEVSEFSIGGGTGPYQVSSSNKNVATVSLVGNTVSVKGVAKGFAQIMVFDSTGFSVNTTVVVDPTGTATALYVAAANAVAMEPGAKASYVVGGGTPAYVATSSNVSVATAEISNGNLVINAVSPGNAQVLVFDATGVSVSIALTVGAGGGNSSALYTTAGTGVVMAKASSSTYVIGGGKPPYKASSSNSGVVTVSATISGTELTISSIAVGSVQVSVFDATGASVSFSVTVSSGDGGANLFTTAGNNLTLSVGVPGNYVVGGGVAPYSSTSSNASVATATVTGGTALQISPVSAGNTQVTVYDSSGNSVTVTVAVVATATGVIAVQPDGAGGNVGDALKFLVSGGTPPYAITVNNTSIASVAPATLASSGESFTATLLNVGSTIVTINDAAGQVKAITLNVSQINTILRLSPNAILVGEDSTNVINLNIFGGAGPYRAFTSDQTLSSVSVNGSVLSVGLGTNGSRCINPVDSSGVRVPNGTFDVTITVLDNLGASATSIVTIKDNGRGVGGGAPSCN